MGSAGPRQPDMACGFPASPSLCLLGISRGAFFSVVSPIVLPWWTAFSCLAPCPSQSPWTSHPDTLKLLGFPPLAPALWSCSGPPQTCSTAWCQGPPCPFPVWPEDTTPGPICACRLPEMEDPSRRTRCGERPCTCVVLECLWHTY